MKKLSRSAVGLALRSVREASGMTLSDLAVQVGITPSSLSRTENGLRDLDFSELVAVSEVTRLDLDAFRTLAETFEQAGADETSSRQAQLKEELRLLQRAAVEAAVESIHAPRPSAAA